MGTVIEVQDLVKKFGPTTALAGLDLVVREGEVHGFLGPNGAGKSTTIRVLLGMVRADSGAATLLGGDPWSHGPALHRRLAYVPGDVSLWPGLSGGEVIDLMSRLRGGVDERRRAELLERFDLDPRRRCRTYSKGNRQKVALVAALSSDVELLLLDEPTSGLDPLMEKEFRDVVAEERGRGRTVLLSSHILSEVEHLCDTLSIIKGGRRVESGSMEQIRHLTTNRVVVTLREPPPRDLDARPGVHGVTWDGRRISAQVDPAQVGAFVERLLPYGVEGLVSEPPSLEDVFLRHYAKEPA